MNSLSILNKRKLTTLIVFYILIFVFKSNAQISTFPYFEDFETSNGGWVSGGTLNDWVWGTPSKPTITAAGGGSKCYINGGLNLTGTGYNYDEVSYVISPTFNFSSLAYPWISFKLFWETEKKYDGGNLQYSLNGGTTWIRVGNIGDPIDCMNDNWYNTNNISKLVALDPSKTGWGGNHYPTTATGSGNSNATGTLCQLGSGSMAWVLAKHCLTGLAGQPSVKFRITFGAGNTCNYYDGLAFDNILIQEGMANAPDFSSACANIPSTINFTSILPSCPNPTATTLTWNFGDPSSGSFNVSNIVNPSHTFSAPGVYTISLTQTGGPCNPPGIITHTVLIMNSAITASTHVTCFGGNNGSSTVLASNGILPYTYLWLPNGGTSVTGTNLAAGNYTVITTDALGCKVASTISILEPLIINITTSSTNLLCNGSGVASASVMVSGGTPIFTYNWLPSGGTSSSANNLSAGNYSIIVTDANGCLNTATVNIFSSGFGPTVSLTATNIACFDGNTGAASAYATGGIAPYAYSWLPSVATSSTISNLVAGNYQVIVTDVNGCVGSSSISISQPSSMLIADFISNIDYESTESNSTFLFTNTSSNYNTIVWYAFNLPQYGNLISVNFPNVGLYPVTLIATSALGCVDTITKIIKINPDFTFYAPNCFSPNNDKVNDIFLPQGTGWNESTFVMEIYDRWGELIFETKDAFIGWDATYKSNGEKVQNDIYFWKVFIKDIYYKKHSYVGHVTIIN